MTEKVQVPRQIYDSLNDLLENRPAGMLDYATIKDLAAKRGSQTTEHWLHNNMKLYEQIRIFGMEPDD